MNTIHRKTFWSSQRMLPRTYTSWYPKLTQNSKHGRKNPNYPQNTSNNPDIFTLIFKKIRHFSSCHCSLWFSFVFANVMYPKCHLNTTYTSLPLPFRSKKNTEFLLHMLQPKNSMSPCSASQTPERSPVLSEKNALKYWREETQTKKFGYV